MNVTHRKLFLMKSSEYRDPSSMCNYKVVSVYLYFGNTDHDFHSSLKLTKSVFIKSGNNCGLCTGYLL